MAPTFAKSIGEKTEELALEHLRSAGLKLVIRNFRCRVGEIDLVMLDGDCLVIVEVRCRQPGAAASSRFASAIQSIGPQKQRKLAKAALFFLAKHKAFQNHKVRFDVVACDGPMPDQYKLQWIRDAFRPGTLTR
jgi:putative endonuclease